MQYVLACLSKTRSRQLPLRERSIAGLVHEDETGKNQRKQDGQPGTSSNLRQEHIIGVWRLSWRCSAVLTMAWEHVLMNGASGCG